MTISDLKYRFHELLDVVYGEDEVKSLFYLSAEHILNKTRVDLALQPQFKLQEKEISAFTLVLNELQKQKPIQYIFEKTEFYGLPFKVTKDVLIPRQETEELVDLIIKSVKVNDSELKILDIGTGSGCIAVSLAKNLQTSKVMALDISEKALKVARENAQSNTVHIEFAKGDILDSKKTDAFFENVEFDIIVSNPPYVRLLEKKEMKPNVLEHEPHLALFVKDEDPLLFYRSIVRFSKNRLKSKGTLFLEINQYLGNETLQLFNSGIFQSVDLLSDLNGNHRFLRAHKR